MVFPIPQTLIQAVPARTLCLILMISGPGAAGLSGQDSSENPSGGPSILERSPFLPPDWSPPTQSRPQNRRQEEASAYEFRGVYMLSGEYRFLVSEQRSRSGKWVQAGQAYDGYEVRDYDPQSETLTLYFNDKEHPIQLASLDANPTPMPVSGQSTRAKADGDESDRPVRRTIRPASRSSSREGGKAPPPPEWLQKLREEAAKRREQASQEAEGNSGSGSSGNSRETNASGAVGDRPDFTPPPPPDFTPPSPPPDINEIDIPPPPTEPPPEPPQEVLDLIQETWSGEAPGR
ncbi:MAG: hypothetical protein R6V45_11350 [Oceanipulchritudo sp.]